MSKRIFKQKHWNSLNGAFGWLASYLVGHLKIPYYFTMIYLHILYDPHWCPCSVRPRYTTSSTSSWWRHKPYWKKCAHVVVKSLASQWSCSRDCRPWCPRRTRVSSLADALFMHPHFHTYRYVCHVYIASRCATLNACCVDNYWNWDPKVTYFKVIKWNSK